MLTSGVIMDHTFDKFVLVSTYNCKIVENKNISEYNIKRNIGIKRKLM